ncbi:hypothetical protein HZH68_004892 [Vespula germanica]|uniref:Odorant receptor n=1 Tax=Vespula germanica TaxID=30212 RepID=A0A834KPD6_VESGE|nr:hypothetical protein HZH68_004892 [Vespula germanica]
MIVSFQFDEHACWTKKKGRTSISHDELERSSRIAACYDRLTMTTDSEEDINYAIGWNRFNLQILGIWPDLNESDSIFSKYWFIVHSFFMLGFITLPQSAYLMMIWGDLEVMTEILATAILPITLACVKLLFTRYRLESLRPLLRSFGEDWKKPKSENERSVMLVNAKVTRIISIWCTIMAYFMISIYIVPRSLMIAQMQRDQFEPARTVVYPGYFPYDISGTFAFIISCFGQIVAAYSASVSYISVDTFITMLVLHACAQISNLRQALEDLPSGMNEMANDFTKRLIWIVKGHEHLNWLIMDHEGDEFPIEELISIIFFVSVTTIQLYLYCYVGEMLIVESSAIGTSAYMSEWFNMFPKDARNILFVMHRSSIPLRLTAGKFGTISMEMFSNILRTSVGYLSVLLTVTDKNN